TGDRLKINILGIQYYLAHVFENDYNPHDPEIPYNDNIARVYFDNVVLATEYIGPVAITAEKPGCDYNGDGQGNIIDVIKLLRLCMSDQPDTNADYNGDGDCNVSDAISLLLDIMRGNC
ncbi:MAG: hypothetical protein U9N45_03260, partial [Gemmatimonadota bacterium]|nr:hypothetical protein [Gemmatimonadota bacterium]